MEYGLDLNMKVDGGWGWVAATASFILCTIIDGVKYSFGIMFIELVETFHESKSRTSWVISIQIGVTLLSGPIIAALVNRFGCKTVAAVGTIISSGGFIASAFVNSLYALYVTFGFMAGFGFGMMVLAYRVILIKYFDKRLAFATGFANMGSGVGALVFNPLSKTLIDEYTWRGTMLVEAGIILNGLVCALVFSTPSKVNDKTIRKLYGNGDKKHSAAAEQSLIKKDNNDSCHTKQNTKVKSKFQVAYESNVEDIMDVSTELFQKDTSDQRNASHNTFVKENYVERIIPNCNIKIVDVEYSCENKCLNRFAKAENNSKEYSNSSSCAPTDNENNENSLTFTAKDIKEIECKEQVQVEHSNETGTKKRWISILPLKNPGFIVFLIANVLIDISLNIPITFIPDMMYRKGFKIQDAVWTIFVIGVVSMISRLAVGIIADLPVVNRVKLCNSLVVVSGALVILCPFCFNVPSFMTFAVFYGMFSGSSNTLRGILIPELFGSETIADHYGITMFFGGVAALVSLPVSGAIYDVTGSYRLPFIIAGAELIASGALLFLIPTRGCRQVDALSSYMFVFCTEILSILIRKKQEIKEITIHGNEYKISQYADDADDTSLFLDGPERSLKNTTQILNFYAKISGFHINMEKTKVVLLWSYKRSNVILCRDYNLDWNTEVFTVLAVKFSTDLDQIVDSNNDSTIEEIQRFADRSKRIMSPKNTRAVSGIGTSVSSHKHTQSNGFCPMTSGYVVTTAKQKKVEIEISLNTTKMKMFPARVGLGLFIDSSGNACYSPNPLAPGLSRTQYLHMLEEQIRTIQRHPQMYMEPAMLHDSVITWLAAYGPQLK